MKKTTPTLIFLLLAVLGFSQVVRFPGVIPYEAKKALYVQPQYKPTTGQTQIDQKLLKDGTFNAYQKTPWNSKNYPAVIFSNNINLNLQGKAIVVFLAGYIEGFSPDEPDGYFNLPQPLPLRNKVDDLENFWWESYPGMLAGKGIRTRKKDYKYFNADYFYQKQIKSIFQKKGAANLTVLPLASTDFSKEAIEPQDIFFEFGIDHINQLEYYPKERNEQHMNNSAVVYHLSIRDATGQLLKKYGQTVFIDALGGKDTDNLLTATTNEQWNLNMLKTIFYACTWQSAFESLLNQFTADESMAQPIAIRTTALQIKHATDTLYIKLFKLKNTAAHYRRCMQTAIYSLQHINKDIIAQGGRGLDFSGVQMPANTSTTSVGNTAYAITSSVATAALGLASVIANSVSETRIKDLEYEADNLKYDFKEFTREEASTVRSYNHTLQLLEIRHPQNREADMYTLQTNGVNNTATDFWGNKTGDSNSAKSTSGNKSYKSGSTTQPTESTPKNYTTTINAPSYQTNADDFWEEGSAKTKSNASNSTIKQNTGYAASGQQPNGQGYSGAVEIKPVIYKVKEGDTLYGIAAKNETTVEELKRLNNLSGGLKPGMELIVGIKRQ